MYQLRVTDSQTGATLSLVDDVLQGQPDSETVQQMIDALQSVLRLLYRALGTADPTPDPVLTAINTLTQKVDAMSDDLHKAADDIKADIAAVHAAVTNVVTSGDAALAKLTDALDKLKNAGAPTDVVQELQALHTQLGAEIDTLTNEAAKLNPPAPTPTT